MLLALKATQLNVSAAANSLRHDIKQDHLASSLLGSNWHFVIKAGLAA